ncbi:hypothetical protein Ndes2526B_g09350 [Nannochloris sp. 'desiccata']|nr:hypothetical protein KSW81_003622 [Chlorella desiccata (nom. nud.)]
MPTSYAQFSAGVTVRNRCSKTVRVNIEGSTYQLSPGGEADHYLCDRFCTGFLGACKDYSFSLSATVVDPDYDSTHKGSGSDKICGIGYWDFITYNLDCPDLQRKPSPTPSRPSSSSSSSSSSSYPPSSFYPTSGSSSGNVGAIVGGVIGGIAAVAMVAGGFAVLHSRRQQQKNIGATALESGEGPDIQPPSSPVVLNPPAVPLKTRYPPTRPPVDPFMSWVSEQLASNPPIRPNLLNGPYEVQFAQLQVDRPIGEGSFGRVYAGKLNNDAVAIKVLLEASSGRVNDPLLANSALTASSPIMMKLHEEVKIMSSMDSPHVVKFIGVCSMPPCIVTELCAEGSLSDVIKNAASSPAAASQLTWRRRLAMAIDAAEGMRYLHSQTPPIIHRDLKSANMLVTGDFRVKISDFNLSKILDDSTKSSSLAAMNPRWLAPELFAGARGSPPCDVFAFGVVLWELLTLDVPWGNTNPWQIVSTIQRGGRLPIPERGQLQAAAPMTAACYAGYVRLIAKCWAQMPEERPEFGRVSEELRILAAGNV